MLSSALGLYGVYLLLVGVQGNVPALTNLFVEDIRRFVPWILSLLVIALLSENEQTKKLVAPFILLITLNFALKNFNSIESELKKIYDYSIG